MSKQDDEETRRRRLKRRLAILGTSFVLGLSCALVPVEYQVACRWAVKLLSLGL